MYLKSLTLRGFKSFASRTDFEFSPGITAIVGPNGSGKSNIVDALSWVVGEQGAKSLRGASMEDLIFSGSQQRAALGRAKVSLVIDNSDAALKLAAAEVEISRTIFRNGYSEYSLNGESVKLSELQELLAQAGIGKSKHSLMSQGEIDRIMRSSALERRLLLEEAAGIHQYRRRIDKTEQKLQALKIDLDRLEDMQANLTDQLKPLGDQAKTAGKAQQLQAQIRQYKADLLAYQALELAAEEQKVCSLVRQLQQQQESLRQQVAVRQEKSKQQVADQQEQEEAYRRAQQVLDSLEKTRAQLEAIAAVAQERYRSRPAPPKVNPLELAAAKKQLAARKESQRQGELESEKLAHELADYGRQAQDCQQKLADLSLARQEAEEAVRQHRQREARQTEQLAVARAHYERNSKDFQEQGSELKNIEAAWKQSGLLAQEVAVQIHKKRAEHQEFVEAEKKAHDQGQEQAAQKEQADKELNSLELNRQTLKVRQSLLVKNLHSVTEEDPPVGSRPVYQEITVKPGWEKAANTALAFLARAWFTEKVSSRAVSQVYQPSLGFPPVTQLKTRGPFEPAAAFITAGEPLQTILRQAVSKTYFAPSATGVDQIQNFLEENPDCTIIRADGTAHNSYSRIYPQLLQASSLEDAAELKKVEAQLGMASKKVEQARQALEQLSQQLQLSRSQEQAAARASGKAQAELNLLEAKEASITSKKDYSQSELERRKAKQEKTAQKLAESQQELALISQELAQTQAQKPAAEELEPLLEQLSQVQAEHSSIQQKIAGLRATQASLSGHLDQQAQEIEQAQRSLNQLEDRARLAEKLAEQEQKARERARLTLAKTSPLLTHVKADIQEQTAAVTAHKDALHNLGVKTQEVREEQAELTKELDRLSRQLAQVNIEQARLQAQQENLEQRAQLELASHLKTLTEQFLASWQNSAQNFEAEEVRNQLRTQEKKLAELGTVNPLALEEYRALEQRHSYLHQQILDLKKSRADMRALVKELNQAIKESFEAAFEETARHFQKNFAILFPDGQGQLLLTQAEQPLQEGIEMTVRPAGKKIKRLSLLSGGERALVSLAFLTAVFAARPAPFYLLDEVEAALDDRNLGRVLGLLEQLSQSSQLLVITHKPRTVQIADSLYGISMNQGVSQVISQDLQKLKQLLEQAGGR
ncbi:MAG: chromosome segregation protein SMC [Rothia sp. (in: high G+C Gram-positive bacteria)]|nr:chromosome segregation protein SMC [Rothia sp. (in: high G+C Gram-positive bacteria)]